MGYRINLTPEQSKTLRGKLSEYQVPVTDNYTLFRGKFNTCTITVFRTHTLLIQGKNEKEVYREICHEFDIPEEENIDCLKVSAKDYSLPSYIGTDEVGTGDFFGGMVVSGAFVARENITKIKKLGVRDSKEINDCKILKMAPLIMRLIPHATLKLDCLKFNFLSYHQKYNMNQIKAMMHNAVILAMKQKISDYSGIIIDAFTSKNNYFNYLKNEKRIAEDVILEEKAENKYLSVACASIIARYEFLKMIDDLSEEIGFELPKGAGKPVDTAIKKIYLEKGIGAFKTISKMKFKNLDIYRR